MKSKVRDRMRHRRDVRAYERILETASPSMRMELVAMAQRQNYVR
jgi:hypothetical protein